MDPAVTVAVSRFEFSPRLKTGTTFKLQLAEAGCNFIGTVRYDGRTLR